MIDIRNIQGNVIYSTEINQGAKRKFQLMKEDYITLPFSLKEPKTFDLGSYADIDAGLFEVVDAQKPTLNASTGGYDYQLRLDAYYWKWKNKIFKYTPQNGGQEASWSLTATLDVHLGILIDNLNALGYKYRGTSFEFSIDSIVENSAKVLTYENINMIDALSMLAEAWECEWWITDNIIHFGRCEYGTPVDFEIGVNVAEMSRTESSSKYATRLYVFGSTRNLPPNYRAVDESVVVNGVVQRRLMLPQGIKYIDAYENMSQEEAIEEVVIFEDIYPKTDGNISSVETYTPPAVGNEDGTTTEETFYRFKDDGIKFSEEYRIPNEDLKIQFTSGSLNGMEFVVIFNPNGKDESTDEAQLFEIVANEDYGRKLPDAVLHPKVGDKYILIGWDSTKIADLGLVSKAEEQLYQEGLKLSAKRKIDPNTYGCKMFSDYMYGLDENGQQDSAYSKHFEVGDKVNLINLAYFENGRQSRIIGYEYNLDFLYDSPVYTIGETASYSRLGALESKLEALTYAGKTYTGGSGSGVYVIGSNDGTAPTDRNVYSALRSDKSYLHKMKNDRSKGVIASDKGLEAGRFVSGFLGGTGAWIGEDGYSEMSGLTLREFLEVPELRFNRIDVVSGELWNSIAFGMVEEVDTKKRICKIKLEENERCGLHVGDFCRGIFADFGDGNNWEGEDECGFMHLYGFWTSYFTPTKILDNEEGLFRFEYELKPGTTQHPTQSMKFAVYGHPTDTTRQASAYATRTYKRYLNKVDTWVISPDRHIYAQYGDLNGLQIDGVTMQGYGSFQSNAYFRGVQIQLPPEQMESLKGDSAYAAQLTSYVGTVKLDADGNMVGGMFEELNVIADGKNVVCRDTEQSQTFLNVTTKNYRLTTTVQAYKGTTPLYYSADVAAKGSFTLSLACVGCTASVVNGAIIINSITDTKDCRINITVNCEGMAVYNLEYNVTFVQDGKIGEDGKNGENGKNGADAVSYRIEPNIQTISKTMTGTLSPESVKFKLQANKGGVINYYPTLWRLKGRNLANGDWTTLNSADSTTSFDVVFTDKYKYYELSAKTYGDGDVMLGDTLNISIVADGKDGADGEKGASGAMPRYRGEFVPNNKSEPYVYDSEYRDIVLHEGNVCQVYMYGSSITEPPSIAANADNDGKWQRASKFRFVAMDTALIDSANIGGFMFKRTKYIDNIPVGRLESQYGPVVIREIDKSSRDIVPVTIRVTSGNGITVLTSQIIKTKGDYAYALKPTTRLVTLDKDDNPSVSSVSCSLIRKSASGDSSITSIPDGYALEYSVMGGAYGSYTPNDSITVPRKNGATIVFRLLYNQTNIVSQEIIYVFSEESTQSTILYDRYIQFACNDDGSVKFGLPYRFRVSQWQGGKEVPLTNITLSGSYVTIDNERIELDAETGTLKCTNVDLTGVINAESGVFRNIASKDGGFQIDSNGRLKVTGGDIGSFEVSGGYLGIRANEEEKVGYNSHVALLGSCIVFNDENFKAAIGSSVYAPSTGYKALGEFKNIQDNIYSANHGIEFDIRNSSMGNFAFEGNGSGVLSNMICGYGVQLINGSSNAISRIERRILNGNKFWVIPQSNTGIGLPPISAVREALGISATDTSVNFSLPITIMNRGSYDIRVWGKNTALSSMNTSDYPILDGEWWIKAGHSMDVVLGYCNGEYVAFIPVAYN